MDRIWAYFSRGFESFRSENSTNYQQGQQHSQTFAGRITQAYCSDRLFFRFPNRSPDWKNPEEMRELAYINRKENTPCGAVHFVREGRTMTYGHPVGLVLVDPSVLFSFKKDGGTPGTKEQMNKKEESEYIRKVRYPHPLKKPLLSVDMAAEKNREIKQRTYSHYFSWTTGHLNSDGQFSSRKFRNTGQYYQSRAVHNETVLESIRERDVIGVAGARMKIFSTDSYTVDCMEKMIELRNEIASGLPSHPKLPLVFLGTDPVYLQAIISPETMGYTDEQIITRLRSLKEYAYSSGLNIDQLGSLMAKLPPKKMLERVMSLELPKIPSCQKDAVSLVQRSGDSNFWYAPSVGLPTISEFLKLTKQGANFNRTTAIKEGYKIRCTSLLMVCLFSGTWNNRSTQWEYIKDKHPQQFMLYKKSQIEQCINALIDKQLLQPNTVKLSLQDLQTNPFAYVSLLRHGASLEKDPDTEEYFSYNLALAIQICCHNFHEPLATGLINDLASLLPPLCGWDIINQTSHILLWSYYKETDTPLTILNHCTSYAKWAYKLMEHGAVCELSENEQAIFLEAATNKPEAFRDYFGMSGTDFFAYLEKIKQRNSPQPAIKKVMVNPPPMDIDTKNFVDHLFELASPTISEASNFEDKVQSTLETYYKSPHPKRVFNSLYESDVSDIQGTMRGQHDCDHVVRTALFTRTFLQMLNNQRVTKPANIRQMTPEENHTLEELLQIAAIYHDVVAETQEKSQEEIQAALYLIRDMHARISDDMLLEVAIALANKNVRDVKDKEHREYTRQQVLASVPEALINQVPPEMWTELKKRFFNSESTESSQQIWLRAIIRFGDTVDIVRVAGEKKFNWSKLEIPEMCNRLPEFEDKLRTMVKACWNLSAMTGGAGIDSTYAQDMGLRAPFQSYKNTTEYSLRPPRVHNEVVRRNICTRENVWESINCELLRMARRKVASMAGIKTAIPGSDAWHSSKASYHCIYDERDLDQVDLPDNINELELLWLSMGKVDWLPQEAIKNIQETIEKLRQNGFQHQLGTLSEETLRNTTHTGKILQQRNLETWQDKKTILNAPTVIVKTRPVHNSL